MDLSANTLMRPLGRLGTAAQNALEVARFGGLATEAQPAPHRVVSEQRMFRLRHYFDASPGQAAPPVLLVPPLMLAAEIYDVAPQTSAVTTLRDHGADPWVVDFGAPEREEGGLERDLADHVLAVSDAVDQVRELTGRDVHLAGYSQGGMFCYQAAAYRRSAGLGSLITFGSSVDSRGAMPFGVPEKLAIGAVGVLAERVLREWALPAWASRAVFRALDPVKSVRNQIDFILRLHDRDALLPREGQRRFLEGEGWVAWPGPAMADFLTLFVAHNRLLQGGFAVDNRLLTLADITCPILSVVGTIDQIAPVAGVRAIRQAVPEADVFELALAAGHFGLVVGTTADAVTWPAAAGWARWRAGLGEAPAGVHPVLAEPGATEHGTGAASSAERLPEVSSRLGYGLELAGGVSGQIGRAALRTARRSVSATRELAREAAGQVPRLARLEQIQPSTRISLGGLFEERRRSGGSDDLFLYEDRAYSAREFNARIDNVVRGLISIGVRHGEHVGVLMGPRPSALALAVALNRLGAVAVMLRPDGDAAREAALGQVRRIIADPERAALATALDEVQAFVLGGGSARRDFGVPQATDLERIDPREVTLPSWYRPDPGRASELAFMTFAGEGAGTRVSRITNGRWALSAFGTASSAALSRADTVYSLTPLYHPSALMMSVGGAIAGGARLAMATSFEPATFWSEARRYGVTVASYTWTMLRELVAAPPQPGERGHNVRLFIGSGMPVGLWRRVQQRFRPARVLEFYAATEAGAILVNVSGAKLGSMGRPLPGSAEVRLARYDVEAGRYVLGRDGFARQCGPGEVGMLLARSRPGHDTGGLLLRGVFSRGDAWLEVGDLFRRDADGDWWRVDNLGDVIHAAAGPVFTGPIRDALGGLPAIDLAVAYGVRAAGAERPIAVAAVTLQPDARLAPRDLTAAMRSLPPHERPQVIRVVDRITVTTWYRPVAGELREEGIPEPGERLPAWYLDRARGGYRALSSAAHRRLTEAASRPPAGMPAGGVGS